MFATPKWEQDLPNLNMKFEKKIKRKKHKDEKAKFKGNIMSDNQSKGSNKNTNTCSDINILNDTPNERNKAKQLKSKRKYNDPDGGPLSQEKNDKRTPSVKKLKLMATSAIQILKVEKRNKSHKDTWGFRIDGNESELKKTESEQNDVAPEHIINEDNWLIINDDKHLDILHYSDNKSITLVPSKSNGTSKGIRKDKSIQSHKKEKLKQLLQHNTRTNLVPKENNLRTRMLQKLKVAQFRYINERLYTSTGDEAQKLFAEDPSAFQAYHSGFQQQVSKWPINPLECIIKRINKMSKNLLIADMGCGDATLSQRVPQKVRSFELVASAPGVEACNMAHTPLASTSMDVVVYCLALMGTNLTDFLLEANRVLKMGGLMIIAEVESRFESVDTFIKEVQRLGFKLTKLDKTQKVFLFFDFKKIQDPPAKKGKLPKITLKPCLYKKR